MCTCPNCKKELPDGVLFCTSCGTPINNQNKWESETVIHLPNEQNQQEYPQPQYQPPFQQQPFQQTPYLQPKKKGLQGWHIALIVLGGLFVLGIIIAIITFIIIGTTATQSYYDDIYNEVIDDFDDYDYYNDYDFDFDDTDLDFQTYARGMITDNTYSNFYADLEFTIPEGFTEGDEDFYASMETPSTFCDLAIFNTATNEQLILTAEDLSAQLINYDEFEYMESVLNVMKNQLTSYSVEMVNTDYFYSYIAGTDYYTAKLTLSNGVTEYIAVKIISDVAYSFVITTINDATYNMLIDMFTPITY